MELKVFQNEDIKVQRREISHGACSFKSRLYYFMSFYFQRNHPHEVKTSISLFSYWAVMQICRFYTMIAKTSHNLHFVFL
jgi:hypothetical protein